LSFPFPVNAGRFSMAAFAKGSLAHRTDAGETKMDAGARGGEFARRQLLRRTKAELRRDGIRGPAALAALLDSAGWPAQF
jgi:hypothetical protein